MSLDSVAHCGPKAQIGEVREIRGYFLPAPIDLPVR